MKSPLPGVNFVVPVGKNKITAFGSERKMGHHTGVDLICKEFSDVTSIESGVIVGIITFAKEKNKKPWINPTEAVLIEGESGVFCYGNILHDEQLNIGDNVNAGQFIGNVIKVAEKSKQCFLRLELFKKGTKKRLFWKLGSRKPSNLLDPTPFLISLITRRK